MYSDQITDSALIDAYLGGDGKAFSAIVHRHRSRLTHVARKYANNEMDVQDIVQEAFFKASVSLAKYRGEAQLSTWLHRLVKNAGYDFLNHRSQRESPTLDSGAYDPDRNPALAYDTEEEVDAQILVSDALATLRPEHREVLYLTDILGYSLSDVAEIQGVRPGTIKSRRSRAKETLRVTIGHQPAEEEVSDQV